MPPKSKTWKTIAAIGKTAPTVVGTIALAACAANIKATPTINSETQMSTASVPPTVTAQPMVGVIETPTSIPSPEVPTPKGEVGIPIAWSPPTIEQARAGVGGSVPADVQGEIAKFEAKVSGKIPAAATIESAWNQGYGNDYHLVTYVRNSAGNILWSTGAIGFNEYPIYWVDDGSGTGTLKVVERQTFAEIPESKEAAVVFTGTQGKTGNGEKPVVVKDIVTLPDGMQVFAKYFDYLSGEWKINPYLPDEIKNTPEAPVIVPEGFAIAEGGLLKNPETGKNVLAINPEADWKRVREEIIGGLWQANIDYYKITGERSDALNYSLKEEFIQAALKGKTFEIGIPVRDNLIWEKYVKEKGTPRNYKGLYNYKVGLIRFENVRVRFDNIQIQVLDAPAFKEYLGGTDWLDEKQEAFSQGIKPSDKGNGAIHFGVNPEGQLVITTGSYYFGDELVGSIQLGIGRFASSLPEKYPTYFREDGLGVNADKAASFYLALMTDWLNQLPTGEMELPAFKTKDSRKYKYFFVPLDLETLAGMDAWYLNPPILTFAK